MKKVRIKEDLRATEREFGLVLEMIKMKGEIYNIDREEPDSYRVGSYYFSKQDCEIIEDEQPIYDDKQVSIRLHTITYDFVEDMTQREIATMLLLLQKQGITKQQIRDMANDNKIKEGDKVFVNFTCNAGEKSKEGIYLRDEMLKYNHTIQTIANKNSHGFDVKDTHWSFAEEWLTKVVE